MLSAFDWRPGVSPGADLSSFAYSLAVFMLFVELFLVPGALYELFLQILRETPPPPLAPIVVVILHAGAVASVTASLTNCSSHVVLLFALLTTISNRSVVTTKGSARKRRTVSTTTWARDAHHPISPGFRSAGACQSATRPRSDVLVDDFHRGAFASTGLYRWPAHHHRRGEAIERDDGASR